MGVELQRELGVLLQSKDQGLCCGCALWVAIPILFSHSSMEGSSSIYYWTIQTPSGVLFLAVGTI